MVALGLYLGDWWRGLSRVEQAGGVLWKLIEPLGRRWLPVRRPRHAFLLGLLWGWLPFGLVYSVLIWCISAGGVIEGALLMASFGLGTLPILLAMGAFAAQLAVAVRRPWARSTAGALVAGFGIYTVLRSVGLV
jgi:sulfite exporter TauE/SafE